MKTAALIAVAGLASAASAQVVVNLTHDDADNAILVGESVTWTLRPWYGTELVTELPGLDARPRASRPDFALRGEEGARHVDVFGVDVRAPGATDEEVLRRARDLARCLDRFDGRRVEAASVESAVSCAARASSFSQVGAAGARRGESPSKAYSTGALGW